MSKANGGTGGGGAAPPAAKGGNGSMDTIQDKLASIQLDGNGGQQQTHGTNFFAFPPPPMGIDVDGSGAGGSAVQHGAVSNGGGLDTRGTAGNAGPGPGMYKKSDGGHGGAVPTGGGRAAGGDGGAVSVSRRYGVPLSNNSRSTAGSNRGVSGVSGSGSGSGVAFSNDDRRRGGSASSRHGGSMNGGGGIAGGRPRVGYESPGVTTIGGPAEQSPLQIPHGNFGGASAVSPSSAGVQQQQQLYAGSSAANGNAAAGNSGMGQQIGMQAAPPVGVGIPQGMGGGNSVHAGSMNGHIGHMDPSQQAMMGQMQSGVYYGTGTGYGGGMTTQNTGSAGMSHMNQASAGYPSSPGHSVGYGMQSGQQMGGIDMQQGLPTGFPVGAGGGMVHNIGVLPTGATGIQSPYGAYWHSGDIGGYGGISNGTGHQPGVVGNPARGQLNTSRVSSTPRLNLVSYGGSFATSDSGVRDVGSTGSVNKQQQQQQQQQQQHNHYHHQQPSAEGAAGQAAAQRLAADPYGVRQPHAYDGRGYVGQNAGAYGIASVGTAAGAFGVGSPYGYGYGISATSPKVALRRKERGRSNSVSSSVGYGGPDPQRESELTVAMNNLTLDDIEGNVFRMSRDQIGCRLLQMKLDVGESKYVDKICGEAKPHLAEMMKDPFGNYLFQKIADKVDEAGRAELVNKVADEMVDAGMNLHGTRSVQKVIEVCRGTPSQVAVIVAALKPATVTLCLDTNGNHVVQRLLQHLAPTDNEFVFEMLAESCVPVATHRHGCCVLQRALDAATVEQSSLLVAQVCKHALQLMQDPYGNYVVQYVLGICGREEADILVNVPLGKVAMLSMQKFSSNVIEKCMDRASEDIIVKYVQELADPAAMRPLLQDQYANYVIQKTLQLAPRDAALSLVESIREHLSLMRNSSGGRRMLTKIAKRFPEIKLEDDVQRTAPA